MPRHRTMTLPSASARGVCVTFRGVLYEVLFKKINKDKDHSHENVSWSWCVWFF
jgi:hypothetical protein